MSPECGGYASQVVFERFSPETRQLVVTAADQARELNDWSIGTEHLLLAITRGSGLAALSLASAGVTVGAIRAQLGIDEPETAAAPQRSGAGQIPFTPRAKSALELGVREADAVGVRVVKPEHILLGILDVADGTARTILSDVGVDLNDLRAKLVP